MTRNTKVQRGHLRQTPPGQAPRPGRPPGRDDPPRPRVGFREIGRTFRQGKWIILVTGLLFAFVVGGLTFTQTPVYRVTSIVALNTDLHVPLPSDRIAAFSAPSRSQADEISYLQNSGELSRRVALRLIEAAETLGEDAYFPILADASSAASMSAQAVADRLVNQVRFAPYTEHSQIAFTAFSTSPLEAVRIANLYVEEYRRFERERSRTRLVATRELLEKELAQKREELSQLDFQWEALMSNQGNVTRAQEVQMMLREYGTLKSQLENARAQLTVEEEQRLRLEEELDRVASTLVQRVGSDLHVQIQTLQNRIAELRMEASEYYVNNPKLRGSEEQIPKLNEIVNSIRHLEVEKERLAQQLVSEALGVGGGTVDEPLSYASQLKARIVEKDLRVNELQTTINALETRVRVIDEQISSSENPSYEIELRQTERERAVVEWAYKALQQDLQQVQIAEQSQIGNVEVVRSAENPEPVGRGLLENTALGLLLGLGFGTGLAFIRRALHQRLQRPEDLRELGYSLVGVIPSMEPEIKATFGGHELVEFNGVQQDTRLISLLNPASPITENYRLARTNIDFLYSDDPPQIVLVTSPEEGDGKTVTAVNLAVTMAEGGRRTLLIDLDLRRPSCHELLGGNLVPGFSDLLLHPGEFLLEEFETYIEDLHFIPAGSDAMPPNELISSPLLRDGLRSLRELFDTIIIDSSPILAVTDAVVLSTQCDATVVVVNARSTDQRTLDVARQTLETVGVSISGVILNRFDGKGTKGYPAYSKAYSYDES